MKPNRTSILAIRDLAGTHEDEPVVMLNLNRYHAGSGFPASGVYREYMEALEALLEEVGAHILWRSAIRDQPVGEPAHDEVLAVWYPSHQAFIDLQRAPGAEENFRLREQAVNNAVIHRCSGDVAPLDKPGAPR